MTRPAHSCLRLASSAVALTAALSISTSAFAQEAAEEPAPDEGLSDLEAEEEGVPLEEEEMAPEEEVSEEAPAAPEEEESVIDHERKPDGSTQLLMGARYRMLITPKFLINMFGVDGGRTVIVHGVGPEIGGYFGETADGFMVMFSPWFASYGMDRTPFKGSNDDNSAWEIIESDMNVWYMTVDAMWDHKIIDKLSVGIGIGAGLGIVTGELRRHEAYQDDTDPDIPAEKDRTGLSACDGPGLPNPEECPADGNYDFNGGSSDRWPVYPWLNFQTGLRYQPVDEFVGRLDIGVGSSGFWLGLGADYSLFL